MPHKQNVGTVITLALCVRKLKFREAKKLAQHGGAGIQGQASDSRATTRHSLLNHFHTECVLKSSPAFQYQGPRK